MDAFCSLCTKSLMYFETTSDVNIDKEIVSVICGHIYHQHCLIKWITAQKKCPDCRKTIETDEDLHKIYFNKKYPPTDAEGIELACIEYRRKIERLTSNVNESNDDISKVKIRLLTIGKDLEEKDETLKHLTQKLADEKAESSVIKSSADR